MAKRASFFSRRSRTSNVRSAASQLGRCARGRLRAEAVPGGGVGFRSSCGRFPGTIWATTSCAQNSKIRVVGPQPVLYSRCCVSRQTRLEFRNAVRNRTMRCEWTRPSSVPRRLAVRSIRVRPEKRYFEESPPTQAIQITPPLSSNGRCGLWRICVLEVDLAGSLANSRSPFSPTQCLTITPFV